MSRVKKAWTPSNWASWKPFGIGEQRPNNFAEVFRAMWENRKQADYAWRILRDGVCDGCALGTSGLRDWTLDGVHLCNIRLRLLRLNTLPPLQTGLLTDVARLQRLNGAELRELGRIPCPLRRRTGEAGFTPISWDEALDDVAAAVQSTQPDRTGWYLTSRGIPNETYYAAQKAVRAIGTNNIDNAARICHAPSTVALKAALGAGASTCSYRDWLDADLIVFFGSNVANNQPVATKYLHYAKKNGARVAVVNTYREPGMERYWIPSIAESALFGTKLADAFYLVNVGGDVAFINGVLKCMIENGWCDGAFVDEYTEGFETLRAHLADTPYDLLERASGAARADMEAFARSLHDARSAVFVWSMGITQHQRGVDNVRAIINLALTKGFVGKPGSGLMPIRGHSGVQGGAEVGAYSTVFAGGVPVSGENAVRLRDAYGFDLPEAPGFTAPEMIDAAARGAMDVLFSVGGNFAEVLPDPGYVEDALARVPLRVHMDIVLSHQMFVEPGQTVLLLPAATRYEIPGGVTQTSTERRVVFSPEIPGPRIEQARPEWEVFREVATRVRSDRAGALAWRTTAEIREEIARVVPFYDGIQHLQAKGDQFQYGGPHLCADWRFGTPDGRARFAALEVAEPALAVGGFRLTTRRGKQFNSMVQEHSDAITGAAREAVLISQHDAERLNIRTGDRVRLANDSGALECAAVIAPVRPGNLQVHWPEGNVLIDRGCRAPAAGVPDYNAVVTVEKCRTE